MEAPAATSRLLRRHYRQEGRILVGYEDGCISAACINGGANDFTAKADRTPKRRMHMFGAFDPIEPAVPGAPKATGTANSDAPQH